MPSPLKKEQVVQKIKEIHGDSLQMVGVYVNTKTQTEFLDKDFGSWVTIPERVLKGASHPSRRSAKSANTRIEKYGSLESAESLAQQKRSRTNLSKYGAVSPLSNEEVKAKSVASSLSRYGTEHPNQSETQKLKIRTTVESKYGSFSKFGKQNIEKATQTNLEKYGREFFLQTSDRSWVDLSQAEEARLRRKTTNLERYGVENVFQSDRTWNNNTQTEEAKEKRKDTNLSKYGCEFAIASDSVQSKISAKRRDGSFALPIIHRTDDGTQMFSNNSEPSYNRCAHYARRNNLTIKESFEFLKDIPKYQSSLEFFASRSFNIEFSGSRYHPSLKYKPDFQLSEKLFMNVDGFMYHREEKVGKAYHFNMRRQFESVGHQILQFTDYEILEKTAIVSSMINARMKRDTTSIFARKLQLRKVSTQETKAFLIENHLKGYTTSIGYALLDEHGVIFALLSVKKKNDTSYKIERFCNRLNCIVVGGYSRLIRAVERDLPQNINILETWVDLRYGTGKHLEHLGFQQIKETLGFYWSDGIKNYNRLRCTANMDDRNLSENEYAKELKLHKIWDAGQRLFRKFL